MRIISKFHDYYDGVLVSKEPVWERKEREIGYTGSIYGKSCGSDDLLKSEEEYINKLWSNSPSISQNLIRDIMIRGEINAFTPYKFVLLGYCGKIIPVHMLLNKYGDIIKCLKTEDEWAKECDKIYPKSIKDGVSSFRTRPYTFNFLFSDDIDADEWGRVYGNSTRTHDLFIKFNTPLFIIDGKSVNINPCLKDYGITGVFGDTWLMAQGIEQFLSNDLVSHDNPDCILDDVGKRDSHGFDDVSFKNTSTKKPRRRKVK